MNGASGIGGAAFQRRGETYCGSSFRNSTGLAWGSLGPQCLSSDLPAQSNDPRADRAPAIRLARIGIVPDAEPALSFHDGRKLSRGSSASYQGKNRKQGSLNCVSTCQ